MRALHGKHCKVSAPTHYGRFDYIYKIFFRIILLALVHAKYEFIWVDVGVNGACSTVANLQWVIAEGCP